MRTRNHLILTTALCLSASALALQPALAQSDVRAEQDNSEVLENSGVDLERNGTVGGEAIPSGMDAENNPIVENDADIDTDEELPTGSTASSGGVENQDTVALEEREDAQEIVAEAAEVVRQMRVDDALTQAMDGARGIFVVPDYGKGAFLVGGAGGEGVLLTNEGGEWSNPVFYNIGAVSVGAEAGASGGSIAMLLMTEDAVAGFMEENNFSLNANADVTVIDWSANAQADWGKGDVVMWADTEGLFAGVGLSASDIVYDEEATQAFYGVDQASPEQILTGAVGVDMMGAEDLHAAFAG